MKSVKKWLKRLLKACLWLLAVVLVAVLTSPLWIGPVVRGVANSVVSAKAGTEFKMGEFGFNMYTGRLRVGDVHLLNPEGCKQPVAFSVGRIDADVEMTTLASDTIIVESLDISDVFASYVTDGRGHNNIEVLMANFNGQPLPSDDEPESEAQTSETVKAEAPAESAPAPEAKSGDEPDAQPAKKVIIRNLSIRGCVLQWHLMTLSIKEPIILKDVGQEKNGLTTEQIFDLICQVLLEQVGLPGVGLKELGSGIYDSVYDIKNAISDRAREVSQKAQETLKEGGQKAQEAAESALKGGEKLIKDAGAGLDSVTEKAKDLLGF